MLQHKILLLLLLVLFVPFISAEDNFLFKQGTDFTLDIKVTNNDLSPCTTCNCTFSIFYPDGSEFIKDAVGVNTNGHCKLINKSSVLGIHNGELSLTDGTNYGLSTFAIEITTTGDKFTNSQSIIILVQLGLIALFMGLGFSFSREKWKMRMFFFLVSLLMGVVSLNSIRIIMGSSSNLASMGNTGLYIGIIVISIMFLYVLIYYTIEAFRYFKSKKDMRWNTTNQNIF